MSICNVLSVSQHVIFGNHSGPHCIPKMPKCPVHVTIVIRHRPTLSYELAQEVIALDQRRKVVLSNGRAFLEDSGRHAQEMAG